MGSFHYNFDEVIFCYFWQIAIQHSEPLSFKKLIKKVHYFWNFLFVHHFPKSMLPKHRESFIDRTILNYNQLVFQCIFKKYYFYIDNNWTCDKVVGFYFTSPWSDNCLRQEGTEMACCSEIALPETENRRPIPSSFGTESRRPIPSSFGTENRRPIPSSSETESRHRWTTLKIWPDSHCRIAGTDPSW